MKNLAYSSMDPLTADLVGHPKWTFLQKHLYQCCKLLSHGRSEHRLNSSPLPITGDWHTLSLKKNPPLEFVDTSGFEVNSSIAGLLCDGFTSVPVNPTAPPLSSSPCSVAQGKQSCFSWHTVPRLPSPVSQEGRLSSGIWVSYPRQAEAQACSVCRSAWRAATLIVWYKCGFY